MARPPKPVKRAFHVPALIEKREFHVPALIQMRAALRLSPEAESDTPLPISADRPRRITQRADVLASGLVNPDIAQRIGGDVAAATVDWVHRSDGRPNGRRIGRLRRRRQVRQQSSSVSKDEHKAAQHLARSASYTLAECVRASVGVITFRRTSALMRTGDLIDAAPATGVLVAAAAYKQVVADDSSASFALGLIRAIADGLDAAEDRLQFTTIESGAIPAIETFVSEFNPDDPAQSELMSRFAELWEINGRFEQARALYGVLEDAHGAARVAMAYAAYLLERRHLDLVIGRLRDDGERDSAFTRGELLVAAYGVADRKADREHIDTLAEDYLRFAEAIREPATETVEAKPIPLRIVAASRPATQKGVMAGAHTEASRAFSADVAELIALGRASGDGFGL